MKKIKIDGNILGVKLGGVVQDIAGIKHNGKVVWQPVVYSDEFTHYLDFAAIGPFLAFTFENSPIQFAYLDEDGNEIGYEYISAEEGLEGVEIVPATEIGESNVNMRVYVIDNTYQRGAFAVHADCAIDNDGRLTEMLERDLGYHQGEEYGYTPCVQVPYLGYCTQHPTFWETNDLYYCLVVWDMVTAQEEPEDDPMNYWQRVE